MTHEAKYIKRKPKLTVFSAEERELVLSPSTVRPGQHRGDPTKLKVKKQERVLGGSLVQGLGAYSKPGKTARDKAKPASGKKTNDPTVCQNMKSQKGSKSSK